VPRPRIRLLSAIAVAGAALLALAIAPAGGRSLNIPRDGRGHFQTFDTREEAFERKKELDYGTFR